MSWWKKSSSQAGQHMTVTRVDDVVYDQLKKIFGEPHKKEKFSNGDVHTVEWKLEILGIKYTIRMDSGDVVRQKWTETSYKVPPVTHEDIDQFELIGDTLFAKAVIAPLIKMLAWGKINSIVSTNMIRFIFEDYKGKLYP